MKIIRQEKLSEQIADSFIIQIESNYYNPGEKIQGETSLAKELGVSRGILREALNILESKGYIIRKPGKGTFINEKINFKEKFINSLKNAEYIELLEAREAIEQKIIDLVIEKATNSEIDEIEKEIEKEIEFEKNNVTRSTNFHLKLAEFSRNKILHNFILFYYDVIAELGEKTYSREGRREIVKKEHEEIFLAIKMRDKTKAKNLIAQHFYDARVIIANSDGVDRV